MFEEKIAQDMRNAWIAMELIGCGFPINCPEDVKWLYFAVGQTEISIVTRDEKKIVALIAAINTFFEKFVKYRDEVIQAAIAFALVLQRAAQETLDELYQELHLERISQ